MNTIEKNSPAVKQPICTVFSLHNTHHNTSKDSISAISASNDRNMMGMHTFESAKDRK